jgi:hypothetical protein
MIDIETRKRRIAQLQSERDALELALSRFAVQLKGRVGGLRTELNRVRLQVAEYRRRIERLKEDETIDPATLEQEVAEEFAERQEQAEAERERGAPRAPDRHDRRHRPGSLGSQAGLAEE